MPDQIADLAMEKVAALLADRVAKALMRAGFDKQLAEALLRAFREQVEEADKD